MSGERVDPKGLLFALLAYGWWGFAPFYFKSVSHVPALEILAHRVVWSIVMLVALIFLMGRWDAIAGALRRKRTMLFLLLSTVLIAGNWFIFIWAIARGRLLEASLGYFINPLVNVVLGFVAFRERLAPMEIASVALAGVAVTWLTIAAGVVPWISLSLALSFAFYGLVRKVAHVGAIEGLTIETAILLPASIAYLLFLSQRGELAFGSVSGTLDLLLIAAGPITAVPLVAFAAGVRRLRLATIGLMQYIAPTLQFLLAVGIFGEPFGRNRAVAFGLIWVALAIYSADNYRRRAPREEAPTV